MVSSTDNWQEKYYFTFGQWFREQKATSYKIDFGFIYLLDSAGQEIACAKFSKGVLDKFDEKDLFNDINKVPRPLGTYYYIVENGYNNDNWLFKRIFEEI